MKKITGILGVVVIAIAMFFNTSNINSSKGDLNLANLMSLNQAQAEVTITSNQCSYIGHQGFSCTDGRFTFTGCISDPTLGCSGNF